MSFSVVFVIYQGFLCIINVIFGDFNQFDCQDENFYSVGRFEINLPPMSTNLLYATQTSTLSTFIIQVVLLEIIASALNGGCYVCPAVR